MGKLINEIGNNYGYLTVVDRAGSNKQKRALWLCKCKCGNFTTVDSDKLRRGITKSCGCYKTEVERERKEKFKKSYQDMIGKTYGHLKVIDYGEVVGIGRDRYRKILCECQLCGARVYMRPWPVKIGKHKSCGCSLSKGNDKINSILLENNINFQREYRIENCKDKLPLPFDFAIFNNEDKLECLIEYQGIQHFTYTGEDWNTKEKFEKTIYHDKIKKDFCEKNGIKLYYITYEEDIKEEMDKIFIELFK